MIKAPEYRILNISNFEGGFGLKERRCSHCRCYQHEGRCNHMEIKTQHKLSDSLHLQLDIQSWSDELQLLSIKHFASYR